MPSEGRPHWLPSLMTGAHVLINALARPEGRLAFPQDRLQVTAEPRGSPSAPGGRGHASHALPQGPRRASGSPAPSVLTRARRGGTASVPCLRPRGCAFLPVCALGLPGGVSTESDGEGGCSAGIGSASVTLDDGLSIRPWARGTRVSWASGAGRGRASLPRVLHLGFPGWTHMGPMPVSQTSRYTCQGLDHISPVVEQGLCPSGDTWPPLGTLLGCHNLG